MTLLFVFNVLIYMYFISIVCKYSWLAHPLR